VFGRSAIRRYTDGVGRAFFFPLPMSVYARHAERPSWAFSVTPLPSSLIYQKSPLSLENRAFE